MTNQPTHSPRVPFPSSYWVIPGKLLAGEYPGEKHPHEARVKLQALLDVGIRQIINLMEPDETDHSGKPFTPYDPLVAELARGMGQEARCLRYPIKDQGIPPENHMAEILDSIDKAIESQMPVYVHCWGGVGRTGTVVGCFLMRHGSANKNNVIEHIARLRENDSKAYRASPENEEQADFVRSWQG